MSFTRLQQGFTPSREEGFAYNAFKTFRLKWNYVSNLFSSKPDASVRIAFKPSFRAGFTVVELLVVVSIFVAITSLVLFRSSQFDSAVMLQNLAYDIGLSMREAQVFSTTVRQGASSNYDVVYGIAFDVTTPTQYVLYTSSFSAPDVIGTTIQTFRIGRGHSIQRFCAVDGLQTRCSDDSGSGSAIRDLKLVFKRPDFDTKIYAERMSTTFCDETPGSDCDSAYIIIAAPNGAVRRVDISATGQISLP